MLKTFYYEHFYLSLASRLLQRRVQAAVIARKGGQDDVERTAARWGTTEDNVVYKLVKWRIYIYIYTV